MQNNSYECINISNVINKLGLNKTSQIGSNIYLTCPFCQDSSEKNGYMKADIIKNVFVCNKCEERGTSLDLYASLRYTTPKDAFKKLLKETPVIDNIPYVFNNPIKDEYYRDLVYNCFLGLHQLNPEHKQKLKDMNFSEEYISKNNFKSVETNVKKQKEICKNLMDKGFKLDGLPGFYQDQDFKWTYKAHKGIFIPAVLNNKIQGIRILLDDKYSKDTENIWFSSSKEYNGTKASNWPIILTRESNNWANIYNSKNTEDIIIATEIILAHKLYNATGKTVIGIPNNINKEILWNIIGRMNIREVTIYFDNYTLLHTSAMAYQNTLLFLQEKGIKTNFRVALLNDKDLTNNISEIENKKIA